MVHLLLLSAKCHFCDFTVKYYTTSKYKSI
nr:MAG TPA: hypothetical protein [Caudoviricetes sp.]